MNESTVSLITLLTVIGGFVGSWLRDRRNRQWLKEDRAEATREIVERAKAEAEAAQIRQEAAARALHMETLRAAAVLREEQRMSAEAIACKLEHVHVAATEAISAARIAYSEANDVNLKIANYNKRLLERGEQTVEKLDTIEHIAVEHTAQLDEIAENTRKEARP